MPADLQTQETHLAVDPATGIVELLRVTILDLLENCTSFAAEVEEAERDGFAPSVISIQQQLAYLREKTELLGRRVQ